jgi:hypothetical protein
VVLHAMDDDCPNFLQRIHIRSVDPPHGRCSSDEEAAVHNAGHSVSLGETTNARHETSNSPSQRTIPSPEVDGIDRAWDIHHGDVRILAYEEATSREDHPGD